MAKPVNKKQGPTVNPRSRAAKRASSPSINVDKSIKDIPRAAGTSPQLGITRNSGVTKKKRSRPISRGQRVRQEKGLARAEAVMDQMEKKVESAKGRLKKRHLRKALWDDINDVAADEQRKAPKTLDKTVLGEEDQSLENEGQENQRTDDIHMEATTSETFTKLLPVVPEDLGENGHAQQNPSHTEQEDELDLIT